MPKIKTKIPNQNTELVPYEERAAKANLAAKKILIASGAKNFNRSKALAIRANGLLVKSVNLMRAAGLDFLGAHGKKQLSFEDFSLDWHVMFKKEVGKITKREIFLAVRVAESLNNPAQNITEAKRGVQLTLLAASVIEDVGRTEPQSPHQPNVFARVVTLAANLVTAIGAAESEQPMENWPARKLTAFVTALKTVEAKASMAREYLEKTHDLE